MKHVVSSRFIAVAGKRRRFSKSMSVFHPLNNRYKRLVGSIYYNQKITRMTL